MEKIFADVYANLPKGAPGDKYLLKEAYRQLTGIPDKPEILDIGCGSGWQSRELLKVSGGKVTAVDNFSAMLDSAKQKAAEEGMGDALQFLEMDMAHLNYPEASFDILWGEGSIYVIGFQEGIRRWKPMLRKKGYMVFTDLVWLKENPPAELVAFWEQQVPAVFSVEDCKAQAEAEDMEVVWHKALSPKAWMDNYYIPLEKRVEQIRLKYAGNEEANKILDALTEEADIYRKYGSYYGYVYFVMKIKEYPDKA